MGKAYPATKFLADAIVPALRLTEGFFPGSGDNRPTLATNLLAVALQETQLIDRYQVLRRRPFRRGQGRSFYQFELGQPGPTNPGGFLGLYNFRNSRVRRMFADLADEFQIPDTPATWFDLILGHDVAAVCAARALMYSDAFPIPTTSEATWLMYLRTWNPGKPHPTPWKRNYRNSRTIVNTGPIIVQ